MTTQDELQTRCTEVSRLSAEALDWVNAAANEETIGPDRKSLVKLLRRSRRRAEKLARSAGTKMSVSVFGPSQAGKSFLVSVLARPEDGRLVADFPGPGGTLDYISEINPEGEGESTGLVTRFTMSRDEAPADYPIRLNLLSEADIARIVINSFYMDGDQSEVPPDGVAISAHLDRFRSRMGSEANAVTYDDVHEIGDYVNGSFGRTAHAAALRSFWDEAAEIVPRLSRDDRAVFFGLLWGEHSELTELYQRLAEGLETLGQAPHVFAPVAALVPRETSIIDVKALQDLYSGSGGSLSVQTPAGAVVTLPRAIVCALAAELVLPMQTAPSELFAETDLLDFPGARNRFERPLSLTLETPDQTVPEILLRGKVAYLFDRYVEHQEITSMLLCIPDSNMDTIDLPGLVDNWIALTHGASPERRAEADCILFFVMTKFDKHLGDSAASGGEASRFERRMFSSLQEKFGRGKDDWVNAWTPGQPFQNCFWLRNPNYFVDGLMTYDDARREVEIRPDKVGRIAELRDGCLSSESVKTHFHDAAAAWDAALSLNDGGVSYLTAALTSVCKPDSKIRQISGQIARVAKDLSDALGPYYVSDDLEERIAQKLQAADGVIDCLEAAMDRHRFGAVMSALTVDQDGIADRIARVPASVRISSAMSGATASDDGPGTERQRPGRSRPTRSQPAAEQADTTAAPAIRTLAPEVYQAETAIEVWVEGLHRLREDKDRLADYGLTDEATADLIVELIHGLRRLGVPTSIAEQLKAISFGMTVDKQAQPAAIVCSEEINRFVTTLGTEDLPEADRPQVNGPNGSPRAVFAKGAPADTVDTLPAEPRATADQFWTDWVHAVHAMFEANAKDGTAGDFDPDQNRAIGQILSGLSADVPTT